MLTKVEVERVIEDVLSDRLKAAGFLKSDVQFDTDFDGEKIIRVTAHVENPVINADDLFTSVDEIQSRLLKSDDARYVYLRQAYPGSEDGRAMRFGHRR